MFTSWEKIATVDRCTPTQCVGSEERKKLPLRSKEWCNNISKSRSTQPPFNKERRQRVSAGCQGIPYEEWTGFTKNGEYCEKFDEACRERIRAKYDCMCFVCGLSQDDNVLKTNKRIKLSVHHVDKNKDQGCNGVKWNLIPLCIHCHGSAHHEPLQSRIEYVLSNT